jgi:hypothetical protein
MELQEPTVQQKLDAMLGIYQQKLANEQLSNAQLTVDNQILREQVGLLQQQLAQYNDVGPDEDGAADTPVQGPSAGDEIVYADSEGDPATWTDISKVEEVAEKALTKVP